MFLCLGFCEAKIKAVRQAEPFSEEAGGEFALKLILIVEVFCFLQLFVLGPYFQLAVQLCAAEDCP